MAENLDNDLPKNNIRFEELKNILKNEKIEEKSHPQQLPLRSNQSSNVQAEENASHTLEKPVSNPVHSGPKLSSDLYSEILAHVIREQRTLDAVVKFGMIGKEAWIAMTYFFQTVNQLKLSKYVEFRFEAYFDYYSIFCNKYDNLVKELMTIAVPFVNKVIFEMPDKKWYNHFFEILSKNTKQKVLEIYGLTKVDDVAKMALKNLVNNGVSVKFGYVNDYVLEDLPDCCFDSLIFYGWQNVSASSVVVMS
uniref:Uncharacterized protein n=1 Tax=Panagrolaimus sp. JU765 TaxID=591449 RepID=A0AC34RJJ7_9BILA